MSEHAKDPFISIVATDRGFIRGDFTDISGQACSIQESSLATAGAIWFGLAQSADGLTHTPNRMHLTSDELLQVLDPLRKFADKGEAPTEPITFRDCYGAPCMLSAANGHQISFGIVLPKHDETPSRGDSKHSWLSNIFSVNSKFFRV